MCRKCSVQRYAEPKLGLRSALLTLSVLFWITSVSAMAQTDTFITGSGLWSEDENWSLDALPTQGNDCVLPANSVVTSDVGGTCASFALGSNASLTVNPGYLNVYGPNFVNQSTITVGHAVLDFAQVSATTTMSGGGIITLTDPASSFTGGQNTVINTNNTIQGQGYMGVTQFTNQSLINANVPSGTLQLHAGVGITNTGTVEASNGATLQLFSQSLGVPFNNSGGIIQVLAGSTVQLHGYAVSGGTLVSIGSGMFTTSGDSSLSNLTNKANYLIVDGGSTTITGTINNQGSIQAKGTLFVNGNATLDGGSVPISAPSGTIGSLSGAATLINGSNIAGSGFIGDANLTLTNHGTINATDTANPMVFGGHQFNNSGTLEASNGGKLQIQNGIDNAGGTIQALNGSTVLITTNTGMVSGGTLTTSGTGVFDSNNGTLDGTTNVVTNAGSFHITQGNLLLQGTINNTGTIAQNTAGDFIILNQPTVLEGSGKLVLSPGTAMLGSSTTALTNNSTIEGAGSIGSSEFGIVNGGTILANSAKNPKALTIAPDSTLGFTNNGKLMVNKGNLLNITGLFNNVSGTTLSGGSYAVSGSLQFQGSIATNAANITLTGAAAQILNSFTNSSALAGLTANAASGSVSLQSGQVLTTATNLSNSGKITIGVGSGLSVGGSYTQTAGTTTVDGTLTAPTGLTLQKGSLLGKGKLSAAVTSGASLTAGDSATKPGQLTVTGSYTQNSTGTLNISIANNTAGTYGQVAVSNGVSLGGTLSIKRVNGFVPAIGDTFSIVTGSAVTGQFATVKGLSINSGEHFEIAYTATAVTLTVVSGA